MPLAIWSCFNVLVIRPQVCLLARPRKTLPQPLPEKPMYVLTLACTTDKGSSSKEYTEMYPGMAKTARQEGFEDVAEWCV